MNIAILTKLRVTSGPVVETIKDLKQEIYRARIQDHYETAFYLSEADPHEFYTFSLFLDPFCIPKFEDLKRSFLAELSSRLVLLEYYAFQLDWEYRKVSPTPVASTIRLAIYPAGFPAELIGAFTNYVRPRIRTIPGLLGVWVGQGAKNENMVRIVRLDWSSQEELHATLTSPAVLKVQKQNTSTGMLLEYSTLSLHDILQDEISSSDLAVAEARVR